MGAKDTNFSLNSEELSFLSDTSFFSRKKLVTGKITEIFGALEVEYEGVALKYAAAVPDALFNRRGKISRGENYKGLPYIILDYPATFQKKGVFAFRTLMWWGHEFSFTFHLSGNYFDQYFEQLFSSLNEFENGTRICINTAQWEHHQQPDNYIELKTFLQSNENKPEFFTAKRFLKLSKVIPFTEHALLSQKGTCFLEKILSVLK